jgi:uncharacterized protein (DUF1499 family)
MNKDELHNSLEALKLEIDLLDSEDKETQKKLYQFVDSMEQLIDSDASSKHSSMKDAIVAFVDDYEIKYPRLTAIANDLMNKLMGMGI